MILIKSFGPRFLNFLAQDLQRFLTENAVAPGHIDSGTTLLSDGRESGALYIFLHYRENITPDVVTKRCHVSHYETIAVMGDHFATEVAKLINGVTNLRWQRTTRVGDQFSWIAISEERS